MSAPDASNTPSASDLQNQVRGHEVALAELNNLASSRFNAAICSPAAPYEEEICNYFVCLFSVCAFSYGQAVYQRNGNIFFRTTTKKATAFEQKQLESAKARLQKLSSS